MTQLCGKCGGPWTDDHHNGCPNLTHTADQRTPTTPIRPANKAAARAGIAAARQALRDAGQ